MQPIPSKAPLYKQYKNYVPMWLKTNKPLPQSCPPDAGGNPQEAPQTM